MNKQLTELDVTINTKSEALLSVANYISNRDGIHFDIVINSLQEVSLKAAEDFELFSVNLKTKSKTKKFYIGYLYNGCPYY